MSASKSTSDGSAVHIPSMLLNTRNSSSVSETERSLTSSLLPSRLLGPLGLVVAVFIGWQISGVLLSRALNGAKYGFLVAW